MIFKHEGEDFAEVKFGMTILKYAKSSFERQISEAVLIQQERKDHHILNSRSEYNSCSLPRLSTRMGEQEEKEWNRELEEEKKETDIVETKIRQMRKERNKARLSNEKNTPASKRMKIEGEEYIY